VTGTEAVTMYLPEGRLIDLIVVVVEEMETPLYS